jgi:hypothetical protein
MSTDHPQESPPARLDYAPSPPGHSKRRRRILLAILIGAMIASTLVGYRMLQPPGPRFVLPAPQRWFSPVAMHEYFIERFVDSDGFGSERMGQPSMVSRDHQLRLAGHAYATSSIDLISLHPGAALRSKVHPAPARFATIAAPTTRPFAYTQPFNVTKAHLQESARRPLREPELAAINNLVAGEETVVNERSTPPLLIGAVRASSQCLKCHEGPAGRMLGAFSYSLQPISGATGF